VLPAKDWTRWHRLVVANDRACLTGMVAADATLEEVHAIRAADRKAQGVTATEEEAVVSAIGDLEKRCQGKVLVARLPHTRTAPLVDRLAPELGGPGFDILVVLSPTEVNVFAPGWLIQALAEQVPAGWYGGNLPSHGYFGLERSKRAALKTAERLVEKVR
jgi:hypothetical protein